MAIFKNITPGFIQSAKMTIKPKLHFRDVYPFTSLFLPKARAFNLKMNLPFPSFFLSFSLFKGMTNYLKMKQVYAFP